VTSAVEQLAAPKARRWDPRLSVVLILAGYLVLGFTILGFNRTPLQAVVTTLSACALEVVLGYTFKKKLFFPLSAMITSFSLSILLNYSHNFFVLFVPVYFAIGSKYLFTYDGRHIFNPAQVGITFSLVFAGTLITAAPAYQWIGISSMSPLILALGMLFLVPQVGRLPLVISFLFFYAIQLAIRAFILRNHLPWDTLFVGTIASPAFILFAFFMITDPATSPKSKKQQILFGFLLAAIDLYFHRLRSYYTFFYAGFTLQAAVLTVRHFKAMRRKGTVQGYLRERFLDSGYYKRPLVLGSMALAGVLVHNYVISPIRAVDSVSFTFEEMKATTIDSRFEDAYLRLDPRLHNIAKYLASIGDAVAAGDFDGDGRVDLYFTHAFKRDEDRSALYRNMGDFRFERVSADVFPRDFQAIEETGVPTYGLFSDYDGDGDEDLFVAVAHGASKLYRNLKVETGTVSFTDVSKWAGIDGHGSSVSAIFLDVNRDGRLDLFHAQLLPATIQSYDDPKPRLSIFDLPEPEFEGDERMFRILPDSWHLVTNGGANRLYLQTEDHRFQRVSNADYNLEDTSWTMAVGSADFDNDGWTDLYIANDFGPDRLLINQGGATFAEVEGTYFGDIGKDTYKGMNASVADFDRNAYMDVYISNAHEPLQAEGSLLWMFAPPVEGRPAPRESATRLGVLNENRFGWGAAAADFDNDGWVDLAQANGLLDDSFDRRFDDCPDYWYENEKLARADMEIFGATNKWGDMRGFCIFPRERDRLYLNLGDKTVNQFVDVSEAVGLNHLTNSRGVAAADLDDDGALDLVISNQHRPGVIYRNVPKHKNGWIGFRLVGDGSRCNRQAVGSQVTVRWTDGAGVEQRQVHEVQSTSGFAAQRDRRVHFGFGPNVDAVDVSVTWCGQAKAELGRLDGGRYHELRQ